MTTLLETIRTEYPKAYAEMLKFFNVEEKPSYGKKKLYQVADSSIMMWHDRLLYDFFDHYGLYVEIQRYDRELVTLWEWRLGPFESYDSEGAGGFQNRTEAEGAAFLEAARLFEMD